MTLYEIVIKSELDYAYVQTKIVLSFETLTHESESVKTIANCDSEWGEYIHSVNKKKIIPIVYDEKELSEMDEVLNKFN